MAIEKIELMECNGCKMCVSACPMDVIRFDESEQKPHIAYMEDCTDCYVCEDICPASCIMVTPTKYRRVPITI